MMCQSGTHALPSWGAFAVPRRAVSRTKKGIEILTNALDDGRVPVDRPLQHGPADERLDGARQLACIATAHLTARHRFLEQLLDFRLHRARVRKRVLVKLGI